MIRFRKFLFTAGVLLGAVAVPAQTKLQQQLSKVDLGVQAVGEFSSSPSGPVTIPATNQGQIVTLSPSNTVGALVTIRYVASPYLGAEFNGGYSRYTENLSVAPGAIQTQADEFTLGYLATPPYRIFGVKPYASAGVGGLRFAPTAGGGEGAPHQGRLALYYHVGVQKDIVPDVFGIRLGFRELFYTAPDFFQNYLTINKRATTSEPMIGVYLRF
ncbi:MAG TPA: hypothetical protein VKV02_12095 [Acidobacteriaceae bacterium]|nr:hypothetical protein [Acidobacteriaceae bacterium]